MQGQDVAAAPGAAMQGFRQPVAGAQACFRAVMNALAMPGTIQTLADCPRPPAALDAALAAVALTLADHETPLWLDDTLLGASGVTDYLRFHTSAKIVTDPKAATFALIADASRLPPCDAFAIGTLDYPDRSTTLLVAVPSFVAGPLRSLTGPGIATVADLRIDGLPADFDAMWASNHARFPQGIDMVFACKAEVAALPRSTRVSN